MAKVSPFTSSLQWRYFLSLLQALPLSDLTANALRQGHIQRWSGPGGWLLVATGTTALLFWNGRLVLATSVGIAVMMLVYLLHDWRPKAPSQLRTLMQGWNQPLALAIVAGGVGTFTTYLAASILAESESAWIALGALLQGAGTLSVLVLLVWQMLNRQAARDRVHYHQWLADLTHADPLKRLIAVRQLTSTAPDSTDSLDRRAIIDYFRLLLSREQEPLIREAVLDGLQMLDRVQALQPSSQPALKPVPMKRLTANVRKPVSVSQTRS